ncbi:MAG: type I-E CRISPR-associated protein Cse2/CasB [Gemmataceae bacterium]|nr:type I-E CRISPR-associated protein Cse2/CasB [Gemmataceae bacterium]
MTVPQPTREQRFADHLAGLAAREDSDARAALAALRRGLGKEPGEVAEVAREVMPFIHDTDPPRRVAAYFRVASLFAGHQLSWRPADDRRLTNLGASFRILAGPPGRDENEGATRRFVALLNAHPEELDRHLRHAISLLRAHEVAIDWAQLLRDVQRWDDDERRVQLAWARAFWGAGRPEAANVSTAAEAAAPA